MAEPARWAVARVGRLTRALARALAVAPAKVSAGPMARLQGLFWQHSERWRRPARHLRRRLSALRYRLPTRWRGGGPSSPPRVVHRRRDAPRRAATSPLIVQDGGMQGGPGQDGHVRTGHAQDDRVPTVAAEALRLVAAAEDLDLAIACAGEPGAEPAPLAAGDVRLLRGPAAGDAPLLVGRLVPLIAELAAAGPLSPPPPLRRSGHLLLRPDVPDGRLIHRDLFDVERALAELPPLDGPPALLFLLPYLAVGGAERLLFDLLADLTGGENGERVLVVTLDPHRAELGQTVDRCRRLTPYVFTLGDWLPRRAAWGALRHLIRRYRVETLFSWNGTVDFYDRVHELRRDFQALRILHQLYHHRGGWTARTSPRVLAAVDLSVAVNREIVAALERRGAPKERIRLIHHGVGLPAGPASPERRGERRRQLGLPPDAVVVGTFIRLHAQKRPLDILKLARRFEGEGVHFLLVGGGPLDDALDARLAARPLANLVRRPMTRDPLPLYDAVDLCLMTSSYEGLPVFLLDGFARSLPGVAPAVGDIPLLFEDGGGLLARRPGDLDGLEAAIRRLLDPAERARRGALARRSVERRFGLARYRADYRRALGLPMPEGDR